jgi:cytochrome c oxidase subunit 1
MFISGMNSFLGSVFTFTTLLIAIHRCKTHYITTLWKGNSAVKPRNVIPPIWIGFFIIGGLTGIILRQHNINVHDTYCCCALSLSNGYLPLPGMFAGIYHCPKMFGRIKKNVEVIHFWVIRYLCYGAFFQCTLYE